MAKICDCTPTDVLGCGYSFSGFSQAVKKAVAIKPSNAIFLQRIIGIGR
jgi:hypothetical protein